MANGPVEMFRMVAYDSTNPSQPPQIMSVPAEFYPVLGKIVIQWAMMEQEAVVLTAALLAANKTTEHGLEKRDFSRRWKTLLDQFSLFASSEIGLKKEMQEIDRLITAAKPVRDGIAHKRIKMGIDDNGNFLKFEVPQKNNPWSKPYYLQSLQTASANIGTAAGRLFRFTNPDHPTSAGLPGRSLLQHLPNMDHVRFPVKPERSHPPRS